MSAEGDVSWNAQSIGKIDCPVVGHLPLFTGRALGSERGMTMPKLHVFALNTTAIKLYETSGFKVTNLDMAKQISPL